MGDEINLEGWRRVRLGDVTLEMGDGGTPDRGEPRYFGGDISWVVIDDVRPRIHATTETLTKAGLEASSAKLWPAGTIILTTGASIGEIGIAETSLATKQGITGIVPDSSAVTTRYLFHTLARWKPLLNRLAQGSTFKEIRVPTLSKLQVLLPPLPEQRRIAAMLDAIDVAIERTEAVIEATERLRNARLQELLTRGIPSWHTEWKAVKGIGTVPADWEVVRLGDVATIERGKFSHRPRNEPRFYGGCIPFVQTGDVVESGGKLQHHTQTLNQEGLSVSRLFPAGTIIMTIAANIGETAIAEYPVAFPDSLVGIIPSGIGGEFLEYHLRLRKARLEYLAPQSAQKNINLEDLRPMLVPVPSTAEQHGIVDRLKSMEASIDTESGAVAQLQTLKKATADALLSGRVRVPPATPVGETS